jgi:hypothetical protein
VFSAFTFEEHETPEIINRFILIHCIWKKLHSIAYPVYGDQINSFCIGLDKDRNSWALYLNVYLLRPGSYFNVKSIWKWLCVFALAPLLLAGWVGNQSDRVGFPVVGQTLYVPYICMYYMWGRVQQSGVTLWTRLERLSFQGNKSRKV